MKQSFPEFINNACSHFPLNSYKMAYGCFTLLSKVFQSYRNNARITKDRVQWNPVNGVTK